MSDRNIAAYPLQWPIGWPKTKERQSSRFNTTLESALSSLKREIQLMGGENVVLSSNYTLGANNPKEPGVVAYFDWVEERYPRKIVAMAIPCDRWTKIQDNVRAIALTVEAMRGMERWGAKHMIKSMFMGFKALPAGDSDWRAVLKVQQQASAEEIKAAYRKLANELHPDKGGKHEDFIRVQKAYETAVGLGLVA